MRSEIAQKIIDETSQEVKDKVRAYGDSLAKEYYETKVLKFVSRINARILRDKKYETFKHIFLHNLLKKYPVDTAISCAFRLRYGIDF